MHRNESLSALTSGGGEFDFLSGMAVIDGTNMNTKDLNNKKKSK